MIPATPTQTLRTLIATLIAILTRIPTQTLDRKRQPVKVTVQGILDTVVTNAPHVLGRVLGSVAEVDGRLHVRVPAGTLLVVVDGVVKIGMEILTVERVLAEECMVVGHL